MVAVGILLVPLDRCVRGLVVLLKVRPVHVALCLLLAWGVLLSASTDLERFISYTGLDPDLVAVFSAETPTAAFLFVCVHVNERTLSASMGERLAELLPQYVDRNTVLIMVTAEWEARFDPGEIAIVQGDVEVRPSAENTVSVTGDFLSGEASPNPATMGLVVMGSSIDASKPYAIKYGDYGYAHIELRTALAAQELDNESSPPHTAGLASEPAQDACQPCPPLTGCLAECFDPCDPCTGIQSIFPLFLLLLLGL